MTDDQQESLDELKRFTNFAYLTFSRVEVRHFFKRKKNVLLPMYANICDLADSVYILLSNERVNSAQNLIRSMQETLINTRFILISGSQCWVDSYLMESELEMKKFVNGTRDLRIRYPNVDTSKATFTDNKLKELERRVNKLKSYVKSKHGNLSYNGIDRRDLSKQPYSLRDKTKIIDYYMGLKSSDGNLRYSDEWQYLMVYKYLSGGTHIGSSYLASNYLSIDQTGRTLLKHGNKKNIQLCSYTAYAFLFDTTSMFSKQFKNVKREELKEFQKVLDNLRQKIE